MESLLLTFDDVGHLMSFSPATIANWAYRRKPAPGGFPSPIKIGRLLRYRRIDIERWIGGQGEISGFRASTASTEAPIEPPRRPRGRPRKFGGA